MNPAAVEQGVIQSGLIGRNILASRSPWLHEQEAKAQGLDLRYDLFDFSERGLADEALGPFLLELRDRGFVGVNVTYPFKQAVIDSLDSLAESARLVGAVNTVAMRGGRTTGHNTDMHGFRDSLAGGLAGARPGRVLQLGAGGAGAAVASALVSLDAARLDIFDVDPERAEALADHLRRQSGKDVRGRGAPPTETGSFDGIVNATPIGMNAHRGVPIDPDLIDERHWVADIVYFPLETELLRVARAKGCRTIDGSGMVIGQAAQAFEIITGHAADTERMRRSFFATNAA
ncbi:MAG: shikimate dehydrogenase [Alphaproteobacteria bacterium]|nr:shikimate dehydrogenase [Alphaproteobacteria bacterium]